MGFKCIACDSGECLEHGSKFHRMASMETLTVAGKPLVRVHTCPECDTWELFDKPANEGGDKLGEVALTHSKDFPYPSINAINVDGARGQGLGRQIVVALASFYGGLTSDPQRNTNPLAKNMWRSIPGVEEVVAPPQYQHGDKPAERRLPWETDEFLTGGKMFVLKGGWRWKFQSSLLMRQSKGIAKI